MLLPEGPQVCGFLIDLDISDVTKELGVPRRCWQLVLQGSWPSAPSKRFPGTVLSRTTRLTTNPAMCESLREIYHEAFGQHLSITRIVSNRRAVFIDCHPVCWLPNLLNPTCETPAEDQKPRQEQLF
ncbi:unnamed protein product [Peniophora sp. CBMAI 1063]|nr:unnamed protein product [Peniophora sp. CBMAI 1063]